MLCYKFWVIKTPQRKKRKNKILHVNILNTHLRTIGRIFFKFMLDILIFRIYNAAIQVNNSIYFLLCIRHPLLDNMHSSSSSSLCFLFYTSYLFYHNTWKKTWKMRNSYFILKKKETSFVKLFYSILVVSVLNYFHNSLTKTRDTSR